MMWFGFISLLSPLIGVVLIAWAVHTIWRAVMPARNAPKEPACERCRYPIVGSIGAAGFICPECGSDLRVVGIITPMMEIVRRGSVTGAILAWTFLVGAVSYFGLMGVLIATSFSQTMVTTAGATTSWSQTLTPNSPLYQSIEIEYDSDWQSVTGPIEITLTPNDGHPESLGLDPVPRTVIGLEGGQTQWDEGTVRVWFGQMGLDMGDPEVGAAAAEVSRVIDLTIMAPDNAFTMNLAEHTHTLTPVAVPAAVGTGASIFEGAVFWLAGLVLVVLVYAGGVVGIVVRRRRLVGRARGLLGAG
ncbi:MAG: hypothetical protein IT431_14150 [Phycisphaerales bacterium]|nr:hypothetical protein [Phycisphaerales bacterium]